VHRLFQAALAALGAPTVDVIGPWEERWKTAKRAITALLSAREG
jgi:hypothetical protein